MTKSGRHDKARAVFEACANAGWTGTMNWMSYLDDNGYGGDYDPDASTEWDLRSAELGRKWVDQAADAGLDIAVRMRDAGYDPDEVTPDADNWKYAPLF